MELDKATRAQVLAALAAALIGTGFVLIFTQRKWALVLGWLFLAIGIAIFAGLLIDRRARSVLRHPFASHKRSATVDAPRMTGGEAEQIVRDRYWGSDRYKGTAEWDQEAGHAMLSLQCRDAGQVGVRITVRDRQQKLELQHEFHTHVDANGLVNDIFPETFPNAPARIARGKFGVTWEVLVSGGVWVQAAVAEFYSSAPDMDELLRRATRKARSGQEESE